MTTIVNSKQDDTDEDRPYPKAVVGIIDAVAWLGLLIGVLVGIAMMLGTHSSMNLDGTTTNNDVIYTVGGVAIIFTAIVQWAFLRATSLVVDYLWAIQANTNE